MRWVPLALVLVPGVALAECPDGTCVPDEDMQVFVELLKEKKCLQTEKPSFELDPVMLVRDKDGRIFYSGAQPRPYTLRMRWCSYEVTAEGEVDVVAGMVEPPTWGLRLRPKAAMGILAVEAWDQKDLRDGLELSGMLDFLYWEWLNLNATVGVRSVGAAVGVDVTRNFGAHAGYATAWLSWRHNPHFGLWFAF